MKGGNVKRRPRRALRNERATPRAPRSALFCPDFADNFLQIEGVFSPDRGECPR